MKKIVFLSVLLGTLCVAPSLARADEGADQLRATNLSTITTQTPRIADLRQEYAAFGTGTLPQEKKEERDRVRTALFYALVSRGQAYEFTGQIAEARADYDSAEHHGFYYNVEAHVKVDMTQLYMGQARVALLEKRWNDAAVHAYTATGEAKTPFWRAEALGLESSARLYEGRLETAQTRAEQMLVAAGEANTPSKKAVAYRRLGAALFFRGDLEGARAKWKEGSTFDGRLGEIDPFDPNQIALNAALAKDSDNLEARLKRASYFNGRALALEGKTLAAEKIADDFLDGVMAIDGAPPLPKTKPYQGGWSNVIELRSPTAETMRRDAIADADFALNSVSKQPSPFTGALYLERARARRGLPATKDSLLQISDDYLEAQHLAPNDVDVALEAGRFFAENQAPRQVLRLLSLALARSARPNPQVLQQRDALFAALPKKPIEHPATLKSALDWKNRGNEVAGADPLNALDCYRKAVQIDPKFADGWNNMASIYARFDMIDRQRDALNRALQLEPKHRIAYANRAALHLQLSDFPAALADAEKAVEFATTPAFRANALVRRGEAKAGLQQRIAALDDFDAALTIEPENATAWAQKGLLELRAARFGLASVALEKSVEFAPSAQAWAALALARGLGAATDPLKNPDAKAAWENATKTATRADWTQTLRLIVELYQSGQALEPYPLTVFYREGTAAKNKFSS